MSEMVERVAAAIDRAAVEWCAETQKGIADMPPELLARAAIEAMEEPTEAMIHGTDQSPHTAGFIWRWMIEIALKP